MKRRKELEQLKREYQEIPIPESGVSGVQAAIERAQQKKRLKRRTMRYLATVAAAALLLLIMPQGIGLMIGMNAKGGVNLAADAVTKGERYEEVDDGSYENAGHTPKKPEKPQDVISAESYGTSSSVKPTEREYEMLLQDAEMREQISVEIRRQIAEAVLQGEECFTAERSLTEGFVCILPEQEYYINIEGQLVIVFAPGEIAPKEYGSLEFVIPDEVIAQ